MNEHLRKQAALQEAEAYVDSVIAEMRLRANRNGGTLDQGAIPVLEQQLLSPNVRMSLSQVAEICRLLGRGQPPWSVDIIREDRDATYR